MSGGVSPAEVTQRSFCSSFELWWTVRLAYAGHARSASLHFQPDTVERRSARPRSEGVRHSITTRTTRAIPFISSLSVSWSCFVLIRVAMQMRFGMTSQNGFDRWSVGLSSSGRRAGCQPSETMNEWSNKSLQATRDGWSSSASRFTSFDPACLSSGR